MHSLLSLLPFLLSLTSFALAQSYPKAEDPTDLFAEYENVTDIGGVNDRQIRCDTTNPDASRYPPLIDCLDSFLRWPQNGVVSEFLPKSKGGNLPLESYRRGCRFKIEFIRGEEEHELTSWAIMQQQGSNMLWYCARSGADRRTGGTVVLGDKGRIRLTMSLYEGPRPRPLVPAGGIETS